MKRKATLLTALLLMTMTLFAADGFAQPVELKSTLLESFEWRNIGPERGGRSLTCTGSPGRPNEYYFGATGGGLWKTQDGGTTWFPVTDQKIAFSSVGAVAVAEPWCAGWRCPCPCP